MPIDYRLYPENWFTEIRPAILERANHRCEFCGVKNYEMIFRGTCLGVPVFQDSNGYVFHAETGEFIIQDYNADIEPLSGKPDAKAIRVILTVMHLNHDVSDNRPENLKAACQMHHLRYDAHYKAEQKKKKKYSNTVKLFLS